MGLAFARLLGYVAVGGLIGVAIGLIVELATGVAGWAALLTVSGAVAGAVVFVIQSLPDTT